MARLEDLPPELIANTVARAVVDAVAEGGETEAIVTRALSRAKADLGLADSTGAASSHPAGSGRAAPARAPASEFAPPASRPNGHAPGAALGSDKAAHGIDGGGRPVLTESDVLEAVRSGWSELAVTAGTIVTALARDAAHDAGLRLLEG